MERSLLSSGNVVDFTLANHWQIDLYLTEQGLHAKEPVVCCYRLPDILWLTCMALKKSIHPNIHANIYIPTYQSRHTCVHACACLYLTELLTPGTFTFFFSPKRPSFNTWLDGFANTSFVDKVFSSQPSCQRSLDQFQSPLGGQIEPTSNTTKSCKNQWQLCDSLLYFSFFWCGLAVV